MKGTAFILLCAVALASAEFNKNGCPINPYIDVLIPHPYCNKFYQCLQGDLLERKCASTLAFNVETQECDWPENVDCENRIPVAPVSSEEAESEESSNGNGNDDPSKAPEICAAENSDGTLVAHEQCNKFYQCHNGVPVAFACAPLNLVFNPSTGACDWPENVDCGNGDGGNGDGGNGDGNGDNGNGEDNNSEDGSDSGNGNINDDPSLAAEICAAEDSEGVLVAHEQCHKFYICNNGVPVAQRCAPVDLVFSPSTGTCDWPENVDCGNRVPGGDGDSSNGGEGNGNGNGDNGNGENNNSTDGDSGNGDGDNGNNGGGGNGNPAEALEICAAEGSDGVLVAHENCNQFYMCSEGKPVALTCYGNLLFNPNSDQCDWPENVDCNGRNPDSGNGDGGNGDGDNGNSVGGGNGDPSEAPKICAAYGSDGVLVAHENCNQFYKCSEGKPVVLTCQPTLLFNPNNDQCDWPENVDCSGRNPDSGNGDGGNGDGDNGNSVGGGNGDPSKAPKICAAHGSDGVLVAHENCNQFYKCSEGKPVVLTCQPTLLFNPNNDQCDWPENVDCNGRSTDSSNRNGGNANGGTNGNPSEAPEICAAHGSDGVLVAHENCNQFYECSVGKPVVLTCQPTLLFNPNNDQCDWPENVDCNGRNPDSGNGDGGNGDGDNGNSVGGGNGDPSDAPKICAAHGSDGVLVAHENCNQFYQCSEGKPVALTCYGNLMFNPNNDQCDWPENVNCGTRYIFTSFNKHLRRFVDHFRA